MDHSSVYDAWLYDLLTCRVSIAPSVAALNYFENIFALNDTFTADVNKRANDCGYTGFLHESLTFPPIHEPLPPAPNLNRKDCKIRDSIVSAASSINPCFNMMHLTDSCPKPWDVMSPQGQLNYFNQTDVKSAIHAPSAVEEYRSCSTSSTFPNDQDGSVPSALGPLPGVIERTNNTIITHGLLDFLMFINGTLISIQNMTWNGAQGFQRKPSKPFNVPSQLSSNANGRRAAEGRMGTVHTERGLTFISVDNSGHRKFFFVYTSSMCWFLLISYFWYRTTKIRSISCL